MRIHMVASVRNMINPGKVNGFGREEVACRVPHLFRPFPSVFHTSRPDEVTCVRCLRALALGYVNLTPMSAEEREQLRKGHQEFRTKYALSQEAQRAREVVVLTA